MNRPQKTLNDYQTASCQPLRHLLRFFENRLIRRKHGQVFEITNTCTRRSPRFDIKQAAKNRTDYTRFQKPINQPSQERKHDEPGDSAHKFGFGHFDGLFLRGRDGQKNQ
ncbi:MAG: hypothetical protein Q4D91_13565 [Lautropia sp.]|nr:hypothetical protein [Lautropia sp.]